jgi:hypothetical protein
MIVRQEVAISGQPKHRIGFSMSVGIGMTCRGLARVRLAMSKTGAC